MMSLLASPLANVILVYLKHDNVNMLLPPTVKDTKPSKCENRLVRRKETSILENK